MAPLASVLCLVLIGWLVAFDARRRPRQSLSLLLPLAWVLLRAARPLAAWLGTGIAVDTPDDYLAGSPIDRFANLALIAAAVGVLVRRRMRWGEFASGNRAVLLLYLYLALSTLWADYPFVALKRWIKESGNILMVLVILTEHDPEEAVKAVFSRAAYILVPWSALLVRFFRSGRAYSRSGGPMYVGVATHKNGLAILLLVCCLVLLWDLTTMLRPGNRARNRMAIAVDIGVLALAGWLFRMANSMTSLMCFAVGVAVLVAHRLPAVRRNPRRLVTLTFSAAACFALLETTLGMTAAIVGLLGRNTTLTGRTEVWEVVRHASINPVVGEGYCSFWSGTKAQALWQKLGVFVTSAHNGYLETYIDGGTVGLCVLALFLLSAIRSISRRLARHSPMAHLQFAFLAVAMLHNITESTFCRLSLLWFAALLAAIDYRHARPAGVRQTAPGEPPSGGTVAAGTYARSGVAGQQSVSARSRR